MKIVSLNKDISKYRFANNLEYKGDNFYGHQIGIYFGTQTSDGKWETLSIAANTDEEKEQIANEMLADKSLLIIEDKVSQVVDGKFVDKVMYYLPYYVEGHSAYKPTVNYTGVYNTSNVKFTVTYEILLVDDWECNRYLSLTYVTGPAGFTGTPCTLFDAIESLESTIDDMTKDENCKQITIATDDGETYDEGDILVTFYDAKGTGSISGFKSARSLLNCMNSIRIINIETEIVNE